MHAGGADVAGLAAGLHVPADAAITLVLPASMTQEHGANVGSTALEVLQQITASRQNSEGAPAGSCSIATHGSLNGISANRCGSACNSFQV